MSTAKDRLLANLHRMVRSDLYIIELCTSTGLEIDTVISLATDIYNNQFFNTMTWAADILAKQMNMTLATPLTQAEKNSIVEARWKNMGHSNIYLLQNICDSWRNGDIIVTFVGGKIQITFVGEYGIPSNLTSLYSEISKAAPAHLVLEYLFKYLLIRDIHEVLTITQIEAVTLNKFAF
jgi:hypothetical protein